MNLAEDPTNRLMQTQLLHRSGVAVKVSRCWLVSLLYIPCLRIQQRSVASNYPLFHQPLYATQSPLLEGLSRRGMTAKGTYFASNNKTPCSSNAHAMDRLDIICNRLCPQDQALLLLRLWLALKWTQPKYESGMSLRPLQVQEALRQICWTPETLHLPNCSPVLDAACHLLFSGPRVRMGLHEGVPARIQPHITTGRADYFGKLVNRFAYISTASI